MSKNETAAPEQEPLSDDRIDKLFNANYATIQDPSTLAEYAEDLLILRKGNAVDYQPLIPTMAENKLRQNHYQQFRLGYKAFIQLQTNVPKSIDSSKRQEYAKHFQTAFTLKAVLQNLKNEGVSHCGSELSYLEKINEPLDTPLNENDIGPIHNARVAATLGSFRDAYCQTFENFNPNFLNADWQQAADPEDLQKASDALLNCQRAAEARHGALADSIDTKLKLIQTKTKKTGDTSTPPPPSASPEIATQVKALYDALEKALTGDSLNLNSHWQNWDKAKAQQLITDKTLQTAGIKKEAVEQMLQAVTTKLEARRATRDNKTLKKAGPKAVERNEQEATTMPKPHKSPAPSVLKRLETPAFVLAGVLGVGGGALGAVAMLLSQAGLNAISTNPAFSIAAIAIGALAVFALSGALINHSRNHRYGLFSDKIKCLPDTKNVENREKTVP